MEEEFIEEEIDGSIHSIHVRNFFCHENLEINLNRNVNFIVGRNGSGKSAILTALVVGLGGRASATNRGNNLHSFIKKGANSATIEIKIKNSSPKAYKHNEYGDFITIIRNITASGGSSYKVKSATGEVISTKFEEVNAIILAHDIQVDNPISVLNQDDARSFHASDAKKKYSLFRKATNLDQTETNYVRALENCNKATAIWNRKNEASLVLEKEYKKWKANHEQLQSRDEIEAQKKALQNEYYWSEIADFEREVTMVQNQYDKQKIRIEQLVEKLSKMNQHYGDNTEAIDELKSQLDEKTLEKTNQEQELRALETEVRREQAEWRTQQHAASKHADLLARETRKVDDLEREINNIGSGQSTQHRAELEQRAEAAAAAAAAAEARYATLQHDSTQARAAAAHHAAAHDRAAAAAASHRDRLRQLKQQLRELESRGNDSLAVYGANMVELCQRVKQAVARGEFSAPPRGPVDARTKKCHVQPEPERASESAEQAIERHDRPSSLEELNVSKEKLRTLNEQLDAFKQKEREFKRKVDAQETNMRQVKGKLAQLTSACRTLSEEIEQEQLKLERGVSERQACELKLREDRSKIAQIQSLLEEKTAHVDKLTQEALLLCPRVVNARDRAIVTNELKKTQLKLSSMRVEGLSKAQVAEKLLSVEKHYRRTKLTLERLKRLIDEIKSTTDKHLNFCHRVQTYIARRVQYCFQSILTLRGYSGRMEIDNARGSLEIVCTGRESGNKRHAATTSSLSGGERSYSTVAFIMALWECVELPFYFMDEFDVFMDNVNRKIVMELLIDHALKNTSRQFVFLTPQDASAVTAGPQISIHLMADPRP
ncbi:hypothetical protein evm_007552 [Chilo suppressalis]|nr:hypothetical protein evm_007552 [Chilo suppressalis]